MAAPSSRPFGAPFSAFHSLVLCKASLLCLLCLAVMPCSLLISFPPIWTCLAPSHLKTLLALPSVSPQRHTFASLPTLRAWEDITGSQSVSLTALRPPSHTSPFACSLVPTHYVPVIILFIYLRSYMFSVPPNVTANCSWATSLLFSAIATAPRIWKVVHESLLNDSLLNIFGCLYRVLKNEFLVRQLGRCKRQQEEKEELPLSHIQG